MNNPYTSSPGWRLLALVLALTLGLQGLNAACYHVECRRGLNLSSCTCSVYWCSDVAGRTSDYVTCAGGWGQYQVCRNHKTSNGTITRCTTTIAYGPLLSCLAALGITGYDCTLCLAKSSQSACKACLAGSAGIIATCKPCGNIITCVAGIPETSWVQALEFVEAGGECPKQIAPCDPF